MATHSRKHDLGVSRRGVADMQWRLCLQRWEADSLARRAKHPNNSKSGYLFGIRESKYRMLYGRPRPNHESECFRHIPTHREQALNETPR